MLHLMMLKLFLKKNWSWMFSVNVGCALGVGYVLWVGVGTFPSAVLVTLLGGALGWVAWLILYDLLYKCFLEPHFIILKDEAAQEITKQTEERNRDKTRDGAISIAEPPEPELLAHKRTLKSYKEEGK